MCVKNNILEIVKRVNKRDVLRYDASRPTCKINHSIRFLDDSFEYKIYNALDKHTSGNLYLSDVDFIQFELDEDLTMFKLALNDND